MKRRGIPNRWENYLPMGCRVPGTRFLPFKVPLKLELCRHQPENEQFTPNLLLESTPMLKAVIDLTNTDRYYDSEEFTSKGVLYKKVYIQGGGNVPSEHQRKQFFDAVDQLCETLRHDSDALIGVHCTHGLNRTGYLICKYMVSRMKIDPQEAINVFQEARGYKIERSNYVDDIMDQPRDQPLRQRHRSPEVNWRAEPRVVPPQRNNNRQQGSFSSSAHRQYDPRESYKYHNSRNSYNNRREEYYSSSRRSATSQDRRNRHSSNNYESSRFGFY